MSQTILDVDKIAEAPSDNKNQHIKRKRRSKNIQDGRNFICKCKKSYLSYPALYTHIKTKHPQLEYDQCVEQNIAAGSHLQAIMHHEKSLDEENADQNNNLELLKQYLHKFFPFTYKEHQPDKRITQLTTQNKIYLNGIKAYWLKHKKEQEIHENQIYITTIDNIFGKFLVDLEKQLSKLSFKYLQNFIINLRNALCELNSDQHYCQQKNGGLLPYQMNDVFIQNFQKQQQEHLYMKNPTIICKTLFHFNRWLFQQHFTNCTLYYNAQ